MKLKKIKKKLLIVAALSLVVALTACNDEKKVEEDTQKTLKVEEALVKADSLDDSTQIIDIRHPDKFIGWENEKN